jgi:hypothetical protein
MSRYCAFISYSHADEQAAQWLHHALERYRLPRALVGSATPLGPVPRRLPPVFRDRDELTASSDLGDRLRSALAESSFLIVLCSPSAAHSKWVNEEVLAFKRLHGEANILALIVAGEPDGGSEDDCFPPALRVRLAPDGGLSQDPIEPLAADLRPGKDGRRLALLKLIGGLTGVGLDALVRRDAARNLRRMAMVTAASFAIAVVTVGLAVFAEGQRRAAELQRQQAERALDFLIGTFSIANPATENPRTITAFSMLGRVSGRVRTELRNEPAMSARLLRATGEIYVQLGLGHEAEHDLRDAIALEPPKSQGRALALLDLASMAEKRGDTRASAAAIEQAGKSYDHRADYAPFLDARIIEEQGKRLYRAGRYAEAAQTLARAVEAYEALAGDHGEDIAGALMNTVRPLNQLHDYREVEANAARAAAIYSARYGPNHIKTARAVQDQAFASVSEGDYARADALMDRVLAIYDRVLEPDHPDLANARILKGRILTARGDVAGAVAALDKARGTFARLYGPSNAAVGDVDFYAAEALSKGRRFDEALRRVASTKAIYDKAYGPDDPDQVELLMLRARVLAASGRTGDASRDCADGLALQARIDPKDPALADDRAQCAAIARAGA